MAKCDIFTPTGMTEEEKDLIDEQLRIAKEENTTLQRINDDVNAHRDRIKQLQSEKKEYTGTFKKDREEFDKLSKQILDREIPFEKLQDAFDRVKVLKSRIDAVKKGSKAYL